MTLTGTNDATKMARKAIEPSECSESWPAGKWKPWSRSGVSSRKDLALQAEVWSWRRVSSSSEERRTVDQRWNLYGRTFWYIIDRNRLWLAADQTISVSIGSLIGAHQKRAWAAKHRPWSQEILITSAASMQNLRNSCEITSYMQVRAVRVGNRFLSRRS